MRSLIHLNKEWSFVSDFNEEYTTLGVANGEDVEIPHTVKQLPFNYFDETDYQFVSTYSRSFEVESVTNKKIFLCFDAVAHVADVYVNGAYVGCHKGGYTAFKFDITEMVNVGSNLVVVKVDSTERDDVPPFGNVMDYLCYGGIYREVSLLVVDEVYIEDVFAVAKWDSRLGAELTIDVVVNTDAPVEITCRLKDDDKLIKAFSQSQQKPISFHENIKQVAEWNIDSPKLYNLQVELKYEGFSDEVSLRVGFRSCEFTKEGFFLNNKLVKLVGLNRHQAYPYIGYAAPKSLQEMDAEFLKNQLGCNIVRTSHYPQSQHFVNKCDELGLLVLTEIPGWEHIGDEEWQSVAVENVKEMVTQYRNHPSVVLWGVRINESDDNKKFYTNTNAVAHSLDTSRQTGGIRCIKHSRLLEDVYTYNDFVHEGDNEGLTKPRKVTGKSVAYLVTEHNGHMFPTKSFDNVAKRTSQALRHLRVIDDMYRIAGVCGCIGWCMSDYNTHKEFGNSDKICYHGVSDMFRLPKTAAYAYASQLSNNVVMQLSDMRCFGDYDKMLPEKLYVFTNCDYIKIYNGDYLLGTYTADKKLFSSLPHPPIVVDNLFAMELHRDLKMSVKKSAFVARTVTSIMRKPKLGDYIRAAWMVVTTFRGIGYWTKIAKKYVTRWSNPTDYKVEGYIKDKVVVEKRTSFVGETKLVVKCDKPQLESCETYQMFKVDVLATSVNDEVLNYFDDVVTAKVSDNAEIIGDTTAALIGGVRSFYIKTDIEKGKIDVEIDSVRNGAQKIELEVVSGK